LKWCYFEFLNPTANCRLDFSGGSDPLRSIQVPGSVVQDGKGFLMDYNAIHRMLNNQEPIYQRQVFDGNIGYIKLRAFMLSEGDVESMMNKVKNASAVVIDLRTNGGGALETLTSLAGCFTNQPCDLAKRIGRKQPETVHVKPIHPRIIAPSLSWPTVHRLAPRKCLPAICRFAEGSRYR
jgi:Peptidase family S41